MFHRGNLLRGDPLRQLEAELERGLEEIRRCLDELQAGEVERIMDQVYLVHGFVDTPGYVRRLRQARRVVELVENFRLRSEELRQRIRQEEEALRRLVERLRQPPQPPPQGG